MISKHVCPARWLAFAAVTFAALVLFTPVSAQVTIAGRVLDVVDGRTVVLDSGSGRMTAQLQYIETPEAGQPLSTEVREHLNALVAGKDVVFRPIRLLADRSVGRLVVRSTDVSLQMLRDGAGWFDEGSETLVGGGEAAEYRKAAAMAKSEKRGVWSIPTLRSPAELRAEREEQLRKAAEARDRDRPALVGVSEYQTANRPVKGVRPEAKGAANDLETWTEVFAHAGRESWGLQTYKDPKGRGQTVFTSNAFVEFSLGKRTQKLEFRAGQVIPANAAGFYVLGFQAVSASENFSTRRNVLTVTADKRKITLRLARGLKASAMIGVQEIFYFRISRKDLNIIAAAKNVKLNIDGLSGTVSADTLELIKLLVSST